MFSVDIGSRSAGRIQDLIWLDVSISIFKYCLRIVALEKSARHEMSEETSLVLWAHGPASRRLQGGVCFIQPFLIHLQHIRPNLLGVLAVSKLLRL